MRRVSIGIVAAAATLISAWAFGAWRTSPAAEPGPSETQEPTTRLAIRPGDVSRLEARVARLAEQLEREAAARTALRETVERLERRMEQALASAPREQPVGTGQRDGDADARERRRGFGFDPKPLLDAGFAERDVEAFAARLDDIELRRLYLRDQAAREGWTASPRYARESRELFEELESTRDEFGDAFYDWSLYASGKPNRVQVRQVMSGSAADDSGIEPGDILERYSDTLVLNPLELASLTAEGRQGETTPLDVLRDGRRLRVYVPRGPLGVRIEPALRRPEPTS